MDLTRFDRYRELIDDWPSFVDAVQAPLPTTYWVNTLRAAPAETAERLASAGIPSEPLAWYERGFRVDFGGRPGKSLPYVAGHLHIQEEVSMMPVVLLDPQPGERLLDLCAAPGNKTVQSAVHMEDRGTVVANDINDQRLGMVVRNIERLGLATVFVQRWNAASLPADVGKFDRVLADVPCTCEGTTRKNPEILWRPRPARSERLPAGQTAILRKAVQRCRAGGRVVYSTCTYAPEENELVVDAVLDEFDDLHLVPARIEGFPSAPGITEWQGRALRPEMASCLRAYPHLGDTGGFFVAILERSPDGPGGPGGFLEDPRAPEDRVIRTPSTPGEAG